MARSAKQRAASIRNLLVARRKRSAVAKSTFRMAPGAQRAIRVNSGPVSEMRNSPNKKQRKELGRYEVRNNLTGRIHRVDYKTHRTAARKDAHHELRARVAPFAAHIPRFSDHEFSTTGLSSARRKTMRLARDRGLY